MPAKTFTPWQYTADDGTVYKTRVVDYINSQMHTDNPKIGGAQATASNLPKPRSLKMRTALVYDAVSGTSRRVPCMSTTAYLWATADATIEVDTGQPTVLTEFTKYGSEGERSRHDKKLA